MVGAHVWWSLSFKRQTTGLIYPQNRSQDLAQFSKEKYLHSTRSTQYNPLFQNKMKVRKMFFSEIWKQFNIHQYFITTPARSAKSQLR